jgi:hypothetical protein
VSGGNVRSEQSGQNLSDVEWRTLSRAERDRLRAIKHAKWAAEGRPQKTGRKRDATANTGAAATSDEEHDRFAETPFKDVAGRPLNLQGIYRGASVFFCMSGPSLLTHDLSRLDRRGIVKFGVNNSPTASAGVRCHLWTHVDPTWKWHDAIWKDPQCLKFVNRRMCHRWAVRTRTERGIENVVADNNLVYPIHMPGVCLYERNAFFNVETWLSEPTINWGNSKKSAKRNGDHNCLNVMPAALKIAYSLGFRFVYLLGCDFEMRPEQPYAWGQNKSPGGCNGNNNTYRILNDWFSRLQPSFDKAGFYVFNCYQRSGLRAFPYVPFDEAVAAATDGIPQDPVDAAGWYDPKSPEMTLTCGDD